MSIEQAKQDALQKYPECAFADVHNGMNAFFQLTWVVHLWRNKECFLAGDPPQHVVEGYFQD